jgi:hypothetical protein
MGSRVREERLRVGGCPEEGKGYGNMSREYMARSRNLGRRLPTVFQGPDERFP